MTSMPVGRLPWTRHFLCRPDVCAQWLKCERLSLMMWAQVQGEDDWMTKYFFLGGTMMSFNLLEHFQACAPSQLHGQFMVAPRALSMEEACFTIFKLASEVVSNGIECDIQMIDQSNSTSKAIRISQVHGAFHCPFCFVKCSGRPGCRRASCHLPSVAACSFCPKPAVATGQAEPSYLKTNLLSQ